MTVVNIENLLLLLLLFTIKTYVKIYFYRIYLIFKRLLIVYCEYKDIFFPFFKLKIPIIILRVARNEQIYLDYNSCVFN